MRGRGTLVGGARTSSTGSSIYVDDVDAHCERARAEGAVILREPKDEPYGRLYNAADPEGHRWMFMQVLAG